MATLGMSEAEREAVEKFRRDVVEPSMTSLVILDFWAEWCGPCKQLTPLLEKVAADYADRGVTLVKVNVDEEKFIAAQFRIQSIRPSTPSSRASRSPTFRRRGPKAS